MKYVLLVLSLYSCGEVPAQTPEIPSVSEGLRIHLCLGLTPIIYNAIEQFIRYQYNNPSPDGRLYPDVWFSHGFGVQQQVLACGLGCGMEPCMALDTIKTEEAVNGDW